MKEHLFGTVVTILIVGLVTFSSVSAAEKLSLSYEGTNQSQVEQPSTMHSPKAVYNGRVALYVAEEISRWTMDNNQDFHRATLGIPLDIHVSINDSEIWEREVVWDASAAGYPGITEENIFTVAAIYNDDESTEMDAYPGYGYYFDAHPCDAAAEAFVDLPGRNARDWPGFTHTVLIEKATASWCPNCPSTGVALNNIYNSGDYPFVWLSQVADTGHTDYMQNWPVYNYMDDIYNFAAYPTTFTDGGLQLVVGGTSSQTPYRQQIVAQGARTVTPLDLMTRVEYMGGDQIKAVIRIANGVDANTAPATPDVPSGPTTGLQGMAQSFSFTTTDNEDDDVYYMIDWGDGEVTEWLGPYAVGAKMSMDHTWPDMGSYEIKVMARDVWHEETTYSPVASIDIVCCTGGRGNVQLQGACDLSDQTVDIGDLTNLINHLFISFEPICCVAEADISPTLEPDGAVDIGDLTELINHLFITFADLATCP